MLWLGLVVLSGCGRTSPPRTAAEAAARFVKVVNTGVGPGVCQLAVDPSQCQGIGRVSGSAHGVARVDRVDTQGNDAQATVRVGSSVILLSLQRVGDRWAVGSGALVRKSYRVPSSSMEPTYRVGQTVIVAETAYQSRRPRIGDVIVFSPPPGADTQTCADSTSGFGTRRMCDQPGPAPSNEHFFKRIVGAPGDTLSMVRGRLFRNGAAVTEPYTISCSQPRFCDFPGKVRVSPDSYFVLGDNRPRSDDSRFWGPVRDTWIEGPVGG